MSFFFLIWTHRERKKKMWIDVDEERSKWYAKWLYRATIGLFVIIGVLLAIMFFFVITVNDDRVITLRRCDIELARPYQSLEQFMQQSIRCGPVGTKKSCDSGKCVTDEIVLKRLEQLVDQPGYKNPVVTSTMLDLWDGIPCCAVYKLVNGTYVSTCDPELKSRSKKVDSTQITLPYFGEPIIFKRLPRVSTLVDRFGQEIRLVEHDSTTGILMLHLLSKYVLE